MERRLAKWWVGQSPRALVGRGYETRAQDLANELRSRCSPAGSHDGTGVDPTRLLRAAGWRLLRAPLSAASGGLQAALVPSDAGFVVVVDPSPVPGAQTRVDALTLLRARIAHELGHAFFYEAGSPPRRAVPPSAREERFCDAFAAALLDGPTAPADAVRDLLRSRRASSAT